MERLTYRRLSDDAVCPRILKSELMTEDGHYNEEAFCKFTEKVYERLCDYEDTGLTPAQIERMKVKLQVLKSKGVI